MTTSEPRFDDGLDIYRCDPAHRHPICASCASSASEIYPGAIVLGDPDSGPVCRTCLDERATAYLGHLAAALDELQHAVQAYRWSRPRTWETELPLHFAPAVRAGVDMVLGGQ